MALFVDDDEMPDELYMLSEDEEAPPPVDVVRDAEKTMLSKPTQFRCKLLKGLMIELKFSRRPRSLRVNYELKLHFLSKLSLHSLELSPRKKILQKCSKGFRRKLDRRQLS